MILKIRKKIFEKNGWKIIFFDETEVTLDKVLTKLKEEN